MFQGYIFIEIVPFVKIADSLFLEFQVFVLYSLVMFNFIYYSKWFYLTEK
jgi:hypothetical protein